MQEVTYIFVNTKKTLCQKMLGWLITAFEHGADFASHVAIQFPYLKGYGPCILEALGQGVVLTEYDKYDDESILQCRITISLTDEQYAALEQKAVEIAEHKYSYSFKSCIIGGIANSFSRRFAKFLARITKADLDDELDCSETGAELLRVPEVNPDFCADWADAQITPYDCYIQMVIDAIYGKLVIAKITKYGAKIQ